MTTRFKNILVLAPHTDDGELGAGGFIAKLIEEKAAVYYAAFSTASESIPEGFPKNILKTEVKAATGALGIKPENLLIFNYTVRKLPYSRQEILEDLIQIKKNIPVDLVLMPSLNDIHQDHATVANEGLRAFKNSTILSYELIWNNTQFNTQCFVALEERHIKKKINALGKYKSQKDKNYFDKEFITSLAVTRGVQSGVSFAEAFEVVRLKL